MFFQLEKQHLAEIAKNKVSVTDKEKVSLTKAIRKLDANTMNSMIDTLKMYCNSCLIYTNGGNELNITVDRISRVGYDNVCNLITIN